MRGLGIIPLAAPLGDLAKIGNRHAVGGRHHVIVAVGAKLQHPLRARAKVEQSVGAAVLFYQLPAHALHPFEDRCAFFGVVEKFRVSRLVEVILEDAHFREGILRIPVIGGRVAEMRVGIAIPRHPTVRKQARPHVSQKGLAKPRGIKNAEHLRGIGGVPRNGKDPRADGVEGLGDKVFPFPP